MPPASLNAISYQIIPMNKRINRRDVAREAGFPRLRYGGRALSKGYPIKHSAAGALDTGTLLHINVGATC